jgi:fibro-slime domain-containing protein
MTMKYAPLVAAVWGIACSSGDPGTVGAGGGAGYNGGGGAGGLIISTDPVGQGGSGGNGKSGKAGELTFILRDFKLYDANDATTNPDFENPPNFDEAGNPKIYDEEYWGPWHDYDIVAEELGEDHLPKYKNPGGTTLTTHGEASFKQWFRSVEGTNITQEIPVTLTKKSDGTYEYDSAKSGPLNKNGMFFPIDDGTPYATKFGNQGKDASGRSHNFAFTMEIHTVFTYEGGEHFYFRGDDDVFVYINNKLVINIGGIHGSDPKDVDIDSLGLTLGKDYPLDFFYAERHQVASDLLITTGLELSNNGDIPIL